MAEIGKRDHDFERAVEGMDDMTVLSMYYAQRNRAESAEQRAQRAEAAVKRAYYDGWRDGWKESEARTYDDGHRGIDESWGSSETKAALATPPPEGDNEARLRGNEPDDELLRKAYIAGRHAHPTPEQAHGDALAALGALLNQAHENSDDHEKALIEEAGATVRRHLTASGVPEYRPIETAPEGVRVLLKAGIDNPPVVGAVTHYEENGPVSTVLHYNGDRLVGAFHATHWRPLDSGVPYVPEEVRSLIDDWVNESTRSRESEAHALCRCARELERALASAPAVCEWKPDDEGLYESACGEAWEPPAGMSLEEVPTMRYCSSCGRRIQTVAAPTDGRGNE